LKEYESLLNCIRGLVIEMEKSKSERCSYLTIKGACTFKGDCRNWIESEGCRRHRKK